MISNYVKTAVRSLVKNRTISFINIIGLAIGLAAFILILSYTNHELSFDQFHKKSDRIYRAIVKTSSDNGIETSPQIVAAVVPSLSEDFHEIEKNVRFRYPENRYLGFNNIPHYVKNVLYADSTLFDVFSFRLLQGNPKTALANPFSIVLSSSVADRIFGSEDPIGKMITLDNKDLLTVTGIVEDAPDNSHIQYNAFISFMSLYEDKNMYLDWNGGWAYYTYILVKPQTNVEALASRFPAFMDTHVNYLYAGSSWSDALLLQPLKRIYLHSNLNGEIGPTGNLNYILLFGFIALLIFVIACINFINLTTARIITRMRETGIRKILGATRVRVILQFMTESVIMNLCALLLAFILAESFLPVINHLLGRSLQVYQSDAFPLTLGILLIIVIIGVVAGSYPALYLSAFTVTESVKSTLPIRPGKLNLRKITVVLQYTISIAMIICTLFLYKQLYYVRHKDPGFDRKNTLIIPLPTDQISQKHQVIKTEFLKIPAVDGITVCSEYPGNGFTRNGYLAEGQQEPAMINILDGDEDLVSVLGLTIVKGRNFSKAFATDNTKYLINESYARELNWKDPIGKYIERNEKHEVIGVVRDFNYASMHERIAPLIIAMTYEGGRNYMLAKVKPGQMGGVINEMSKRWNRIVPEAPFDFSYLMESNRSVYTNEQNLSNLVFLFTILAIFIAFLGLFGLSSHETERQIKNIGIRKVNGANTGNILLLLSGNFTKWVMLSFIIACPLAWFVLIKWLQQFAYKTVLSWWIFGVGGIMAMIIALLTVSWQSWKAARRDPVEALRYE